MTASPCSRHPDREAAGACEYCGLPHCPPCLAEFLGRRYCPECLAEVRRLAGAPTGAGPPGTGAVARTAAPAVAGWLSGAVYLIALYVTLAAGGVALMVLLSTARYSLQKPPQPRFEPLDASGLGLGVWAGLFGVWAWMMLAAVLLLTLLLARGLERVGPEGLGLRWTSLVWRDLLVGLGLAGALFISVVGVGAGKGWYSVHTRLNAVDAAIVLHVAFAVILPLAALEEIAVRGYLQRAFGRTGGPAAGLVASSLAFALLHAQNPGGTHPMALVGLFLAGLYLGSAYLITRRLWLPIFVHAGWNLVEGPVFGLPVSGSAVPVSILHTGDTGPGLWTGGAFGPEAGLLLCLLLVVHIVALWAMRPWLSAAAPDPAPTPA